MDKKSIEATFKSSDTEEWLDTVWTRPIGYWWAKFFERLGVHPNVVTVLSMIIGASSAFFFAHGSFYYEGNYGLMVNVIAMLLLAWANFYDSADGQLARMTGKKTRLGRILDGAASEVWFIPIYLSLVYRFYYHHSIEFSLLGIPETSTNVLIAVGVFFVAVLVSGFVCHSGQCGLADYYRQIHLFFLKGTAGSELDNSAAQQRLYDETPWRGNLLWKAFLKTYVGYTRKQERQTHEFQKLMRDLKEKEANNSSLLAPHTSLSETFLKASRPLMKYTNILTFNTRAIVLYATCLLDVPVLYFFFEIVIMSALCQYMRHRHETFCKQLRSKIWQNAT